MFQARGVGVFNTAIRQSTLGPTNSFENRIAGGSTQAIIEGTTPIVSEFFHLLLCTVADS